MYTCIIIIILSQYNSDASIGTSSRECQLVEAEAKARPGWWVGNTACVIEFGI